MPPPPLHLALACRAFPEVIGLLMKASWQGGEQPKDSSEEEGSELMMPLLHVALSSKAPPRVLRMLLAADPRRCAAARDHDRRLPLHAALTSGAPFEAVAILLRAFPEGAAEPDRDGAMPISLAAAREAPVEIMMALMDAGNGSSSDKKQGRAASKGGLQWPAMMNKHLGAGCHLCRGCFG